MAESWATDSVGRMLPRIMGTEVYSSAWEVEVRGPEVQGYGPLLTTEQVQGQSRIQGNLFKEQQ